MHIVYLLYDAEIDLIHVIRMLFCIHVFADVCVCVSVCGLVLQSQRDVCEMSSPNTAVCVRASSPSSLIYISASHHVARTTSSVHQQGQKTRRQETLTLTYVQTQTHTHTLKAV